MHVQKCLTNFSFHGASSHPAVTNDKSVSERLRLLGYLYDVCTVRSLKKWGNLRHGDKEMVG